MEAYHEEARDLGYHKYLRVCGAADCEGASHFLTDHPLIDNSLD